MIEVTRLDVTELSSMYIINARDDGLSANSSIRFRGYKNIAAFY